MGAGHDHGHTSGLDTDEAQPRASRQTRIVLAAVLLPILLLVLLGTALLWESEPPRSEILDTSQSTQLVDATVVRTTESDCGGSFSCQDVTVRIDTGPDAGTERTMPPMALSSAIPALRVGDAIVVSRTEIPQVAQVSYSFSDYQRKASLWFLGALFAVFVVAVARWRGVAAIVGLGISWFVISLFVIPAILGGGSPVLIAAVGASLIMFVLLYLAHGVNARTSIALLGTLASLALTTVLAWIFIEATRLTGGASEEATYLQAAGLSVDLKGLLLAGVVIGSLGVLNDVTVTQAASIWEIHRADPARSVWQLYRSGMRIGRDHIASAVDTLVLAYVGASLPLVILFTLGNQPLGAVLSGEIVAEEIVRTLVGSIGLVASVPITTALAALVASRQVWSETPAAAVQSDDEPAMTSTPSRDTVKTGSTPGPVAPARRPRRREAKRQAAEDAWNKPRAEREFWED